MCRAGTGAAWARRALSGNILKQAKMNAPCRLHAACVLCRAGASAACAGPPLPSDPSALGVRCSVIHCCSLAQAQCIILASGLLSDAADWTQTRHVCVCRAGASAARTGSTLPGNLSALGVRRGRGSGALCCSPGRLQGHALRPPADELQRTGVVSKFVPGGDSTLQSTRETET